MTKRQDHGHLVAPNIQIPSYPMVIRRYKPLSERNLRSFFEDGLFCRHVPEFDDDNEGLIENPASNGMLRGMTAALANRSRRRYGPDKSDESGISEEEFKENMIEFHRRARHKYFANCWRLGTTELEYIWKRYTNDERMVNGFAIETTVGQFTESLPAKSDISSPDESHVDPHNLNETPMERMYVGGSAHDMSLGAVWYQVREIGGEMYQPAGYQAAVNYFKGRKYEQECEFRFLINPFDTASMLRIGPDGMPVGTPPAIDCDFRYFPIETAPMVNKIILAPNSGSEQRKMIENILDELNIEYGTGKQNSINIVESQIAGEPHHKTHSYASEFGGTDNYNQSEEHLNSIRENFIEQSSVEDWPVIDLVELASKNAATVVEGYRHPTMDPKIDMDEYGTDGYQAVFVDRIYADEDKEHEEYCNEQAREYLSGSWREDNPD